MQGVSNKQHHHDCYSSHLQSQHAQLFQCRVRNRWLSALAPRCRGTPSCPEAGWSCKPRCWRHNLQFATAKPMPLNSGEMHSPFQGVQDYRKHMHAFGPPNQCARSAMHGRCAMRTDMAAPPSGQLYNRLHVAHTSTTEQMQGALIAQLLVSGKHQRCMAPYTRSNP
jgi:hypothetical protein